MISKIVKLELSSLQERLVEKDYRIKFTPSVIKFIVEEGYDEKFGARPIKRAIQNKIEDYISEEILKGDILDGVEYSMSVTKNKQVKVKEVN